ncbi:MAG: hypothetical protein LBR56_00165, partial [Sporomusaceae bacterium]|nr:hypothetical protein [Sporomusaceae bacterium]
MTPINMYNPSLWFDIRVYLAVIAGLLLVIAFYNCYAGIVGAIILVAMYKYSHERHLTQQKELNEYLAAVEKQIEGVANNALKNLPLAVAVINDKGVVRWSNSILSQWFAAEINLGDSFLNFFPDHDAHELLKKLWQTQDKEEDKVTLRRNARVYCLEHKITVSGEIDFLERASEGVIPSGELLILYLADITEKEILQKENAYCRPVLGYVQIDNYDDALKGTTEHQRGTSVSTVTVRLGDWLTDR